MYQFQSITDQQFALSSDLEVDLEELVAQKHHPPLLRVLDPCSTAEIKTRVIRGGDESQLN